MTDVGDTKQVKGRLSKKKLRRENELEEVRQILKTPFGRGFLWRILSNCHMFTSISRQDQASMNQASGRRDFGLWLINEIDEADQNGYMTLIQESNKRKK